MAVNRPKAELSRSGPSILMNIGDMAATHPPVSSPNNEAQTMKVVTEEQMARQNSGMQTRVMTREERESGWSQDLSHTCLLYTSPSPRDS